MRNYHKSDQQEARLIRLVKSLIMACALTILAVPVLVAQDRDVAFLPGLRESGSKWNNIISFLEDSLQLQGHAAFFNTQAVYSEQAAGFNSWLSYYPAINNDPAVAHSNGGVVARMYRRDLGTRINGLLTVGTPHKGAPIARSENIALARASVADHVNDIVFALSSFAWGGGGDDPDPDFYELEFPAGYPGWLFESDFMNLIYPLLNAVAFTAWFEVVGLLIDGVVPPQNNDYTPESPAFTGATSINAYWDESSKLTTRVSISTTVPTWVAVWLMLTGNGGTAQALHFIHGQLCFFADGAFFYYAGHPNQSLRNRAGLWFEVLRGCGIEQLWHYVTTDSNDDSVAFDGLIPHYSSEYPGGTPRYFYQPWVPHHQQSEAPAPPYTSEQLKWLREYKTVLRDEFGIAEQPDPLFLSISGPSVLEPGQSGTWTANASGGIGGYSYRWFGVLSGTGGTISGVPSGTGTLWVTVTSGTQTKTASKSITVSTGPPCPPCSPE